jgi:hypothetical protein
MILKGMVDKLKTDITSLSYRVYTGNLPIAEFMVLPAIVVNQVTPSVTLTGDRLHGVTRSQVLQTRCQVDLYGRDMGVLNAIAGSAANSLDGYQGTLDGTKVLGCLMVSDMNLSRLENDLYRLSQDYEVVSVC